MGHSIYYHLLHNVLNFPEEITSKIMILVWLRMSDMRAALCRKSIILVHCRVSQVIIQ